MKRIANKDNIDKLDEEYRSRYVNTSHDFISNIKCEIIVRS